MAFDQVHLSVSAARTRTNHGFSRHRSFFSKAFRFGLTLPMAATAFLLTSGSVLATDNYLVKPMNQAFDDPAIMRRMNSAAKRYAYAESIEKFTDANYAKAYYQEYLPARITQQENRDEISELMTDVRKRMTRAYRAGTPGAKNIMRWLYSGMRPIAEDNYHPGARINAILLISRMDVVPADPSARKPPVPSAVIPRVLFPLYKDASNSDGVRAAALCGLRRYVNLAGPLLEKPQQDALIAEMQTLIEQSPPQGRNVLAHAYLQRFAVDILASLIPLVESDTKERQGKSGLGSYLVGLSTDQTKHKLLAMHAASRLARVDSAMLTTDGRVQKILFSWSSLATNALDMEIQRLEAMTRPKPVSPQPESPDDSVQLDPGAGRRGGNVPMRGQLQGQFQDPMGGDGMDEPGGGDGMNEADEMMVPGRGGARFGIPNRSVQPPEVVMSRRKLNFMLQQFHGGVAGSRKMKMPREPRGLMAAVTDADRKVVQQWAVKLQVASSRINNRMLSTRETYVEELRLLHAELEVVTGTFAVPPALPAPAAKVGGDVLADQA